MPSTLIPRPTRPSSSETADKILQLVPLRAGYGLAPISIGRGETILGAGEGATIRLPFDGVAAQHCRIQFDGRHAALQALHPLTWLNEGPVREALLKSGDIITLGPIDLRATLHDAVPPTHDSSDESQPLEPDDVATDSSPDEGRGGVAADADDSFDAPAAEAPIKAVSNSVEPLLAEARAAQRITRSLQQLKQELEWHRSRSAAAPRRRSVQRDADGASPVAAATSDIPPADHSRLVADHRTTDPVEPRRQQLEELQAQLQTRLAQLESRTAALVEDRQTFDAAVQALDADRAAFDSAVEALDADRAALLGQRDEFERREADAHRLHADLTADLEERRDATQRQTEQHSLEAERLVALQQQIDLRSEELEERLEAVRRQEELLHQHSEDLDREAALLQEERQATHQHRMELSRVGAELQNREQSLQQREARLQEQTRIAAQRESELTAATAALEESRRGEETRRAREASQAAARSTELDRRTAEVEARDSALKSQEAGLRKQAARNEQRSADLEQRSRQLDARREALTQREQNADEEHRRQLALLEEEQQRLAVAREELEVSHRELQRQGTEHKALAAETTRQQGLFQSQQQAERDEIAAQRQQFADSEQALQERLEAARALQASLQLQQAELDDRELQLEFRAEQLEQKERDLKDMASAAPAAPQESSAPDEAAPPAPTALNSDLDARELELMQLAAALEQERLTLGDRAADLERNRAESAALTRELRALEDALTEQAAELERREAACLAPPAQNEAASEAAVEETDCLHADVAELQRELERVSAERADFLHELTDLRRNQADLQHEQEWLQAEAERLERERHQLDESTRRLEARQIAAPAEAEERSDEALHELDDSEGVYEARGDENSSPATAEEAIGVLHDDDFYTPPTQETVCRSIAGNSTASSSEVLDDSAPAPRDGHEPEASPEEIDPGVRSLRSQLASLFGISMERLDSPTAGEDPAAMSREDSAPTIASSADEPVRNHPHDQSRTTEVRCAEPSRTLASNGQESPAGGDDSIESYMQRLLGRVQRTEPVQREPASPERTTPTLSEVSPAAARVVEHDVPAATPLVAKSALSREARRLDDRQIADLRANIDSMRQIANQSARAAVAHHYSYKLNLSLRVKIWLTIACAAVSLVLFSAELWGRNSYRLQAIAALQITLIAGLEVARTMVRLRRVRQIAGVDESSPEHAEAALEPQASVLQK